MDHRKNISEALKRIENAASDYEKAVQEAAETQRAEQNTDFSDYSDAYKARMKENAVRTARENFRNARDAFCYEIRLAAAEIRDNYRAALVTPPADPAKLDALRVFRDFDIPMTREDVAAIADGLGENALGLRALASVADRSGWAVSVPLWDRVPAALSGIENAMKTPVLPGFAQIPEFVEAYEAGPYWRKEQKAVPVMLAGSAMKNALDEIAAVREAIKTQEAAEVHEKDAAQGGKTQEGERRAPAEAIAAIEENEPAAERIAARIGIEKATDNAAARVIADHYSMK